MLKALGEYITSPSSTDVEILNSFALVRSDFENESQTFQSYYLCFGRHDFYLIPRKLQRSSTTNRRILVCSYRSIDKIQRHIDDPATAERTTILLFPGTLKRYKNQESGGSAFKKTTPPLPPQYLSQLTIDCSERELFLAELMVGVKASHMFLTFEFHTQELIEDVYSAALSTTVSTRKKKSLHSTSTQLMYLLGYTFGVPLDFEEVPTQGLLQKHFVRPFVAPSMNNTTKSSTKSSGAIAPSSSTSSQLVNYVDGASIRVEMVEHYFGSVQSLAENKSRALCSRVEDYRLVGRPGQFHKKVAAVSGVKKDVSIWTGWSVQFRTMRGDKSLEFRYVVVLVLRRSCIPPTLQRSVDFVLVCTSQLQDFSPSIAQQALTVLAETLSPDCQSFEVDEILLQATADALLLSHPRLVEPLVPIRPKIHLYCRTFCRVLVQFLLDAEHANSVWTPARKIQVTFAMNASDTAFENKRLNRSSFHTGTGGEERDDVQDNQTGGGETWEEAKMIARLQFILNERILANPPIGINSHPEGDLTAWKMRVWEYLSFCVDGGVYDNEILDFDLLTKVYASPMTTPRLRNTVAFVLDHCLQHNNNKEGQYHPETLIRLLKTGYLQLRMGSGIKFSRFLVKLLLSPNSRGSQEEILEAALQTLVLISGPSSSGGEENKFLDDASLNLLLPALITVFLREEGKCKTLCVCCFVNLSRNNYSVKADLCAGNTVLFTLVNDLSSRDDDLVRHTLALLVNITKDSPELRARLFSNPKLRTHVFDLISKSKWVNLVESFPASDLFRRPKLLSLSMHVLGNLAVDHNLRMQLLLGEEEVHHDADGHFRVPKLVRLLCDVLFHDERAKEEGGLEVMGSALFALKNLSISSSGGNETNASKTSLGRFSSKGLVRLLRDKELKDGTVVDYLLRLIYSLAFDGKISHMLEMERVQEGLTFRKKEFPNLCLQILTKLESYKKRPGGSVPPSVASNTSAPSSTAPPAPTLPLPTTGSITGGILRSKRSHHV